MSLPKVCGNCGREECDDPQECASEIEYAEYLERMEALVARARVLAEDPGRIIARADTAMVLRDDDCFIAFDPDNREGLVAPYATAAPTLDGVPFSVSASRSMYAPPAIERARTRSPATVLPEMGRTSEIHSIVFVAATAVVFHAAPRQRVRGLRCTGIRAVAGVVFCTTRPSDDVAAIASRVSVSTFVVLL